MDNILVRIDKILEKGLASLNSQVKQTLKQIIKQSVKGKPLNTILGATPSNPIYNSKFKPLFTVVNANTKQIVRKITDAMNLELDAISKTLGIEVDRVRFIQNINRNVYNFTDQIAVNVRADFLNYVSTSLIEVPTSLMLESLANNIDRSIRQTELMVKESLAQMNRQHIDSIYKRALPKIQKYRYVGPLDSRTSKICKDWVDAELTRDEWLQVDSDIFIQGLHYGCRHQLVPVLIEGN